LSGLGEALPNRENLKIYKLWWECFSPTGLFVILIFLFFRDHPTNKHNAIGENNCGSLFALDIIDTTAISKQP